MGSRRPEDPFSELYGEFRDRLQGDRWQPDADIFETEKSCRCASRTGGCSRGRFAGDRRWRCDLRISGVRVAPSPRTCGVCTRWKSRRGPSSAGCACRSAFARGRECASRRRLPDRDACPSARQCSARWMIDREKRRNDDGGTGRDPTGRNRGGDRGRGGQRRRRRRSETIRRNSGGRCRSCRSRTRCSSRTCSRRCS